jgi:FlaA1/EpsC-like NDP-sugar epimerase
MTAMAEAGDRMDRRTAWVWHLLDRRRAIVQPAADAVAWALALLFATLLRYDFHLAHPAWAGLVTAIPLAIALQSAVGFSSGLYSGRWRFGSFDEVFALVRAMAITTALLFIVNPLVGRQLVPRSVPIAAGVMALVLTAGTRYAWRLALERRRRRDGADCQRLLVFGAGDAAERVIPSLLRDINTDYVPVALLDDDPAKRRLSISGVRVVGGRADLQAAAEKYSADTVLIAIPSASAALVTELTELSTTIGLRVKVLPPLRDLFDESVGVDDIRDVTPADLLGRHEIKTDLQSIAGYLTGKTVLVTGAGGSIGSELCRQIYRFAPKQLMMLDRDESALHAVQLSIEGRALLDTPDLVLLDLRDRHSLERLIRYRKPDVIFHAAALKHLTLLEQHPGEAVKSNVWATLDLLEIATAEGVGRVVNISTDKAADPCSVLGYTKRLAERLTAHYGAAGSTNCLSVRFGNVIGSRGSVLTTFNAQIDSGGPVTVTHPDVTRYFMTVEEAVQLVIQAGAIGSPGEVLVLDMGDPVRIADVAALLATRSERDVAIDFTGLRPGEKLHEVLLGNGEDDHRPVHPLISHVPVPPLDPERARTLDATARADRLVPVLRELCRQAPSRAVVSHPGS